MTVESPTSISLATRDRSGVVGRYNRDSSGEDGLLAHAAVDASLARATREVIQTSTTCTFRGAIAIPRQFDYDNLRRGVRYRVLFPDRVRTVPALANQLARFASAGAEVRTMPRVPVDTLVIDGTAAVLPRESGVDGPCGLTLFELPGVVGTAVELFERVWLSAVALTAPDLAESSDQASREQKLLGLLSGGYTDVAAAARLGVSVRTVRRMVSVIMGRLGARSRFQAGVKAADRGWLDSEVR